MAREDPGPPWRVIALSAGIVAFVALVGWLLLAGGASAPTPGAETAEEATPEPADPAAETTTEDPDAEPGATPEAFDPTDPETRAALARARYVAGVMDVQLFMVVPGVERLIPVPHQVPAPATVDAQAQAVVEEIINWSGTDMISPLPPEATVREVWVSPGGIAYVDFDRRLADLAGGGSLGELHCVYGVVNSLTLSFPEILAVQILVDGKAVDSLAGHVDLSRPLTPSSEWALIERGGSSFEATSDG